MTMPLGAPLVMGGYPGVSRSKAIGHFRDTGVFYWLCFTAVQQGGMNMTELLVIAICIAVVVGVFWAFNHQKGPDTKWPAVRVQPTGDYTFDIVGEASYQKALQSIAGGRTDQSVEIETEAKVSPERGNKHDKNAVRVEIGGKIVGYLSRADAVKFRKLMKDKGLKQRAVMCPALIVGGWDRGRSDRGNFGVRLDFTIGKHANFIQE
jgi:cation transport ATPase